MSVDRESSSETKSELDNDTDNIHYDLPLDLLSDVTIREHNKVNRHFTHFSVLETSLDFFQVVAAIDVDPTGSRFVSAGRDCLKMWDYNGMDSSLTPFRSFEPFPGCVVRALEL